METSPNIRFNTAKTAPSDFVLARLKYYGGGDWYNDPVEYPQLFAVYGR